MSDQQRTFIVESADDLWRVSTRRNFLKVLGVGGSMLMLPSVFTACRDDDSITGVDPAQFRLDLTTDAGILNYAYALEQLEAAFYTAAIASAAFNSMPAAEQEVLADLQKHEVIHREFFKAALGSAAIPALSFNSTTVASLMSDRATLLKSSQLLEDTGVSAYNGAGKYLSDKNNLLVAGKIVSVEARHAAAIRDIRDGSNGTLFAGDDVVNAQGLDVKAEPDTVLASVVGLNVIDTTASPLTIGTLPTRSPRTADQKAPTPA
jgi:hypothetical protein